MNSEIVGIAPFQIGFADYYFNRATNPQLATLDEETVKAARTIAYLLPALTESVVSQRHQYAADMLIHAILQNDPSQEAFLAAISVLAQDYQVLLGLDKLMGNLFIPKTGPQLARKLKETVQSASGAFGASPYSSTPHGAPIWHWKEPATIANSTRYSSPSTRAPAATNGGFVDTVVQTYHQDPLPPPLVVQAEVFRPPQPPPQYYKYPYQLNYQQAYTPNHYSALIATPVAYGNQSTNFNYDNGASLNQPPLQRYDAQSRPESVQSIDPGPLAPAPDVCRAPNGNHNTTRKDLSEKPAMISPSVNSNTTTNGLATEKRPSLYKKTNGTRPETSVSPEQVVSAMSPPSSENPRRRSSRGTVLTSKARAAGILLGTQVDSIDQASVCKTSKAPQARTKSASPVASVEQRQVPASNRPGSLDRPEPEKPTEYMNRIAVGLNGLQADRAGDKSFVPRSSGRERKPTAKILSSSAGKSSVKVTDYQSSAPRVSSKLRLLISSYSSVPSEISTNEAGAASEGPSFPSIVKGHTSPKDNRAARDKVRKLGTADRMTNDQELIMPFTNIEELNKSGKLQLLSTARKHEKFLTNDKGQSMSQALLQMAQIAADWSESDDDDEYEDDAEAELVFHNKLNHAVQKLELQSGLLIKTLSPPQMSLQGVPAAATPKAMDSHLPGLPGPVDPRSAQSYAFQNHSFPAQSYHPGPGLSPMQSTDGQVPFNHTLNDHQPWHRPWLLLEASSPAMNFAVPSKTDPRSSMQMTDNWMSLLRLQDIARSRGLPISDTMGLEQLTNLLRAHDAGELNVAIKPGSRTIAPTPASQVAMSQTLQSSVPNHKANGYHQGPSVDISPSQFDPPITQNTPRYNLMPRETSVPGASKLAFSKHIQYIAPNSRSSPDQNSTTSGSDRPVSTEPIVPSPLRTSSSGRSTAQHTSRWDVNPQCPNGGPSGGGTTVTQVRKRSSSKIPTDAASANGSTDDTRYSTPLRRNGGSATPQLRASTPQIPNFRRGGIVLSFGKTARKATTA